MKAIDALASTKAIKPQTRVEIEEGLHLRRTRSGIPVVRIHFTADPAKRAPAWIDAERRKYTSDAAWRREMQIEDEAGGGELVFADTLVSHWKKIIISDPAWRPDPRWRVEAGMDHGRTNATVIERCYIDHQGIIYFAGEYYQPGKEVWEHAPIIKKMEDVRKVAACYADPTIFDFNIQQSQRPGHAVERAKSINELYVEQGIELFSPFPGDRSDVSFAGRLMAHWANLDRREPSVRIVCPQYTESPQFGLHNWGCPNLVWELMRRRRVKLTAQQLLSKNASEALVDRENHANDAMKYVLMSHPEPTFKTKQEVVAEAIAPMVQMGDLNSAAIRYQIMMSEEEEQYQPATLGRWLRR